MHMIKHKQWVVELGVSGSVFKSSYNELYVSDYKNNDVLGFLNVYKDMKEEYRCPLARPY